MPGSTWMSISSRIANKFSIRRQDGNRSEAQVREQQNQNIADQRAILERTYWSNNISYGYQTSIMCPKNERRPASGQEHYLEAVQATDSFGTGRAYLL